ncbi:hypothetical protein Gohar_013732 [Gossypium harknessii]|uniref:Uncharacterized protein n=1 Tax=Gossypium harknessii TaxID=34285 RepID=A0A7J9H177_9ROSI|nr:hypothetical protein [Gossypium harknessii]
MGHLDGNREFPLLYIGGLLESHKITYCSSIGNPSGAMDMKAYLLQKFSPAERNQVFSCLLSLSLITIYKYNFEVWLMENKGEYSNTGRIMRFSVLKLTSSCIDYNIYADQSAPALITIFMPVESRLTRPKRSVKWVVHLRD